MASELQETLNELGEHLRGERGKTDSQMVQSLATRVSEQAEESFQKQRSEQTKNKNQGGRER